MCYHTNNSRNQPTEQGESEMRVSLCIEKGIATTAVCIPIKVFEEFFDEDMAHHLKWKITEKTLFSLRSFLGPNGKAEAFYEETIDEELVEETDRTHRFINIANNDKFYIIKGFARNIDSRSFPMNYSDSEDC